MTDSEACDRLTRCFAPRRVGYNRWTGTGYVFVDEPLTGLVVARAIAAGYPVGGYHPAADGTTQVIALDLDRGDGGELARRIGHLAWRDHGVATVLEDSERGRAHLWLLAGERMPWLRARAVGRGLLTLAGVETDHVELRPDGYTPGLKGKGLRLPTMPHPATGRRFVMRDGATGEPLGRTLADALSVVGGMEVDRAGLDALALLAPPEPPPPPPAPRREWRGGSSIADFNARVTVTEVLAERFGRHEARPGRVMRCPFHDDRHASLSVLPDDRRVICHSPGCQLSGRGADAWALHTMEVTA